MSNKQKTLHQITESLGVILGFWVIWVSQQYYLPEPHNTILLLFGIGNILVDGYLLMTWGKK